MLKNTALVVVIGGGELLSVATHISSQSGKIFELLVVASIWYLLATSLASIGQYYLERRFSRGDARNQVPTPLQRLRARIGGPAGARDAA
jgi:polar amino acid transport system permease protein